MSAVEIKLELVNEKIKFIGTSSTNKETPITMDYVPPLGDGEGFLGLELLVMSFAGCVSTAIVGILRRIGKSNFGYRMDITGIKKENPILLEKIIFNVTLISKDITETTLEGIIKKAEEISPVWLAVKNNVQVEWQYKIIE